MILTIRTDKPEAEIGLYDKAKNIQYLKWQANRQLSDTVHIKINQALSQAKKDLSDITGVVFFAGPGSFTGLRIGAAVANALHYSLAVPIISIGGEDWVKNGVQRLAEGQNDKLALPRYGAPPRVTKPKK